MLRAFITLSVVLMLFSIQVTSAEVNPPSSKTQEVVHTGYPVILGDQTLLFIREGIKGATAEERARAISGRIKKLAGEPEFSPDSITLIDSDISTDVVTSDRMIMSVFDADARAEKVPRKELGERYVRTLQAGIKQYQQDYSRRNILRASLYALIATFLFIAALYLFRRLYRKADRAIQAWAESKKVSIHIQAFEIVRAERIRAALTGTNRVIRFCVFLGIVWVYVHLLLSFFPWTRPFAGRLFNFILVPLGTIAGTLLKQIPNLFFLAILALITFYVLKLMRLFFQEVEKGVIRFKGFYPEWAQPTHKICRLLVVAFAAVVAFPYIPGSASPAFKGISIFVGVLFSLGSTAAISNVVAGFTLTYRRAFKIGDRVKIEDIVGDVVEMRLQVTHIHTVKNEEITVPNSMIGNGHVINYSALAKTKGLILHTAVTIGYDAPWRQVHALLLMAAERTPGLLREPAPFVLQKSLDDFYVTYELNVYTDTPREMAQTYSALHRNIQDAFNEYGVQIMSPAYESDPERPKLVPKERWYAAPVKPPTDG
jgi:small-conductance mechanosensitive channel